MPHHAEFVLLWRKVEVFPEGGNLTYQFQPLKLADLSYKKLKKKDMQSIKNELAE